MQPANRAKPEIVHKNIVINDGNAAAFIDRPVQYAAFEPTMNRIRVWDYDMSPHLSDAYRPAIQRVIDYVASQRPSRIPHEMRHWYNNAVFRPDDWNYFACISLLLVDELSALTAGRLQYMSDSPAMQSVDAKTVAKTMAQECKQYMDAPYYNSTYYALYRDAFLDDAITTIRCGWKFDKVCARQKELLKTYDHNPEALFDKDFHDRVSAYLTFGDYCILQDKNAKDAEIQAARKYIETAVRQIKCDVAMHLAERLRTIAK